MLYQSCDPHRPYRKVTALWPTVGYCISSIPVFGEDRRSDQTRNTRKKNRVDVLCCSSGITVLWCLQPPFGSRKERAAVLSRTLHAFSHPLSLRWMRSFHEQAGRPALVTDCCLDMPPVIAGALDAALATCCRVCLMFSTNRWHTQLDVVGNSFVVTSCFSQCRQEKRIVRIP